MTPPNDSPNISDSLADIPAPASPTEGNPAPADSPFERVLALLGSYGLAVVTLTLLLLLTFLGTVEQANTSLYEVQKRYFESLWVIHDVGPVPVPLPGVYLLLVMLFTNLLVGGVLRLRKGTATLGILVGHLGILLLLFGGMIEYRWSTKGHMTLYEGQAADEYESYFEWEITVAKAGETSERVIPGDLFAALRDDAVARFDEPSLPFTLDVGTVLPNCRPRPEAERTTGDPVAVNGIFLRPLAREMEAERDILGAYVRLTERGTGTAHDGLLFGLQRTPWSVEVDGERWFIDLHKRRWKVPFVIRLEDFRRELHPGMGMAKAFESDVVKVEGGSEQKINISMNEPLRHEGYTFFQASWGPSNARPGDPLFSTFAVVRNPADSLPLYACLVIAFGLLLHFGRKLHRHVKTETGRRA